MESRWRAASGGRAQWNSVHRIRPSSGFYGMAGNPRGTSAIDSTRSRPSFIALAIPVMFAMVMRVVLIVPRILPAGDMHGALQVES